jgi:hypothetical protein
MVCSSNAKVVDKVLIAKSTLRTGLCVLLAAYGSACADERITIATGDCATGVHLVARAAPLPEVLRVLSDTLGFQLQLIGSSDSIIDVDVTAQAPELITRLSPADSLIVTQARDPRCPSRFRVAKVWLLSKGTRPDAAVRPASTTPASQPISEMAKQQNRENDNAYRKAHGMPPLSD